LSAPGVNFIVGVGKAPEPISMAEIDAIKAVVASGLHYEPYPYVTIGQRVRVEHGALAGVVGLVTDLKNSSRLIISMNLLMRSVSAEIDRSWVTPIVEKPTTITPRVEQVLPEYINDRSIRPSAEITRINRPFYR